MNNELDNQLNSLIKEIKTPQDFQSVQDQLFKRGVQTLLAVEMDAHLGYSKGERPLSENIRNGYSKKTLMTQNGEVQIDVPRDRQGTFDPVTVPKHKTMSQQLEDVMVLLYAKGMSTTDITDFILNTYGVQYSPMQVSLITNRLLDDIKEWQQRPLEAKYAILWIDAIHYKIRNEGKVASRAAMIVLGVDLEGKQDILAIHIMEHESAAAWSNIFTDLKLRGIEDVLFLCSDNLTGLQLAVESCFPQSIHQICIVHQVRNSLKHLNYKDKKEVISDLKTIYQSDNIAQAEDALKKIIQKWSAKYGQVIKSWQSNWDALSNFLNYPVEIRKLIYTTNIIESFNASLRKFTKVKKVFPNDDSALKSIYLEKTVKLTT